MGDQQAPIGEVFYIEGASSYKYGSVPLKCILKFPYVLFYLFEKWCLPVSWIKGEIPPFSSRGRNWKVIEAWPLPHPQPGIGIQNKDHIL